MGVELNTLCVVGMYQQVNAFAFLAHDADADGHGMSIHQPRASLLGYRNFSLDSGS